MKLHMQTMFVRYQGQSIPPILSYSSTTWQQNKFRTITLLCLGLFWGLLISCEITEVTEILNP